MMAAGAVVALAMLWLLGALALASAGLRSNEGSSTAVCDLAAGAAIVTLLGTLAIAGGFRLSPVPIYLLMLVLAVFAIRHRMPLSLRIHFPRRPLTLLLLTMAAVVLTGLLISSAQDRLWWDGWSQWAFKARVLFVEGGFPRSFLDAGGPYARTNLDYPPGVPLVVWWLYWHAGQSVPALASVMGALWFILLPVLVWSSLRRRVDDRVAAAAALGVAAFWPNAFFATGGTADVVVALALLGAAVEIERGVDGPDQPALWRAGVYLALGALAKNEGWALAGAALAVVGLRLLWQGSRHPRHLLPLMLPLVPIMLWILFTRSLNVRAGVSGAASESLVTSGRLLVFLSGLGTLLSSNPWFPLPVLAALGVFAAMRRRDPGLTTAWVLLAGYFVAICATYVYTAADMLWLLASSLVRVMGALVPTLVYLAVLAACEPLPAASTAPVARAG
jgi:hypothetical protein